MNFHRRGSLISWKIIAEDHPPRFHRICGFAALLISFCFDSTFVCELKFSDSFLDFCGAGNVAANIPAITGGIGILFADKFTALVKEKSDARWKIGNGDSIQD
jgi:hypothetical protein